MTESVRLVVWDLDDTFWSGTVTEGGITSYIQANHDTVIELARRGIMSSVCSKNDRDVITAILESRGILEYFIFPSISWDPKGPRLTDIIEECQLRPSTVMFIDDNPSNRAEAAAMIPGLQVEDESFVRKILEDPRFVGKNDRSLTRLAQYKLLEARKSDERKSSGGNEAFLRSCDVRVFIDYDFESSSNVDRAIEIINRTNQLNYTKLRLPEDIGQARELLRADLKSFHKQSGLVRVIDNYGDYGYVGFFMLETDVFRQVDDAGGSPRFRVLRHFCFSCRTLGMLIEKWLYEHLDRPHLHVVGEVLTDLSVARHIDWVRSIPALTATATAVTPAAPEIRLYGGCETYSIGLYLEAHAPKTVVRGNFAANGVFFRINSAALAESSFQDRGVEFAAEAKVLGLSPELASANFFLDVAPGTAFVFSSAFDIQGRPHYRHRRHGWEFVFELPGCAALDLTTTKADEIERGLRSIHHLSEADLERFSALARHTRENYESTSSISDERRIESMRALIGRVPAGSKLVMMLDHDRLRLPNGVVRDDPPTEYYNKLMKKLAADFEFVGIVSFSDVIASDDEIQIGGNHYDRAVYLRVALRIADTIRALPAKTDIVGVSEGNAALTVPEYS